MKKTTAAIAFLILTVAASSLFAQGIWRWNQKVLVDPEAKSLVGYDNPAPSSVSYQLNLIPATKMQLGNTSSTGKGGILSARVIASAAINRDSARARCVFDSLFGTPHTTLGASHWYDTSCYSHPDTNLVCDSFQATGCQHQVYGRGAAGVDCYRTDRRTVSTLGVH